MIALLENLREVKILQRTKHRYRTSESNLISSALPNYPHPQSFQST